MTEEEYKVFFNELLRSFEGSYSTPAGFGQDGLYFSCIRPPIHIPNPERLTPDQRRAIARRLGLKYGFDYTG